MSVGLRQALLQKGTGLERGGACLFVTVCCDFCDGVVEPLPPSQADFPLWTIALRAQQLAEGQFSVSHGKCSTLRSPRLEERP